MYKYYNPNPSGRHKGDCVIRAISKALDLSWMEVYLKLTVEGAQAYDWGNANSVWGTFLRKHGYERSVIPNTCPDCYTIADFCRDNPQGTYILATGTHAVCVQDGTIYDTWDSSAEIPIYYFKEVDI